MEARRLHRQKLAKGDYESWKKRYLRDAAGFVRDCLEWPAGLGPAPYQEEILGWLADSNRVSIRGPHGLGKTAIMAWVVLRFALTRDGMDWKVVTTASAWRQLEKYLWPEIHKWARAIRWDIVGRGPFGTGELFTLKLKLATGEAFAVASDNPALIEGAHAENILYVFDESKAIIPATFDAAEGALTTPGAMALAFSTPGEPNGRFHAIQTRQKGYLDWRVKHVTRDEVIAAGRMSESWANARRDQWGEKSAVYQNRVAGEFAASDEDSVIPLAYIERANERWRVLQESGGFHPITGVAADVARSGDAKTVLAIRAEMAIVELRYFSGIDTMETAGRVKGVMIANNVPSSIDIVGLGAGVYDKLREDGELVAHGLFPVAFVAGARTTFKDKTGELGFVDLRAAAWWNAREILEDDGLQAAIPPDDILTGDLTAPKWRVMSGGRIRVESKEDIAKRLGRSTDAGDAVVMAYWHDAQRVGYGENPIGDYRG
jgi:hypothetical protein